MRHPAWPVIAACACLAGCFTRVETPGCTTPADCPPGYTSCSNGLCFTSCDQGVPASGDGCCSVTEGDRSADLDCLVVDLTVAAQKLTVPATDDLGWLFVTGEVVDGAGKAGINLWRVTPSGQAGGHVHVGDGSQPLPALLSSAGWVYAAFDQGVMRYQQDLGEKDVVASGRPVGGLVGTGDASRPMVVWVTDGGLLELYDETAGYAIEQKLPADQDLGGGEAFAPVVSGNGRRMYVAWKSGILLVLEVKLNPLGPVAKVDLTQEPSGDAGSDPLGPPVAAPVEAGGLVIVPVAGGKLAAFHELSGVMTRRWVLDVGGDVAGRPLVDSHGDVVVALRDGGVRVVRDQDTFASVVAMGSFGTALADLAPAIGDTGRIAAVAASGRRIVTLLRTEARAGTTFQPGLFFDVPVDVATPLALSSKRVVYGTASAHVAAWLFPEELATAGFAKDGSDAGGTGRVVVVTP